METRGHGDRDRRSPSANLSRGALGGSWAAAHVRIQRRETLFVGGGPPCRRRRRSNPRRRSSDSSLPVRFSGTERGSAHARWYQTIADHYDKMYDPKRATRAYSFLRHLFLRYAVGPEVLDVACGTFAIDVPLVKRGYHVAGRDRSEEMLRVARRNLRTAGVTA